jgi:hypothetical protein
MDKIVRPRQVIYWPDFLIRRRRRRRMNNKETTDGHNREAKIGHLLA